MSPNVLGSPDSGAASEGSLAVHSEKITLIPVRWRLVGRPFCLASSFSCSQPSASNGTGTATTSSFQLLLAYWVSGWWVFEPSLAFNADISAVALALAFAIRAGIGGKNAAVPSRSATQTEQELLFISQLLLMVVHVDLSKNLLHRAALTSRPSHFAYATYGIAVLCFILDTVAVSKAPNPVNSLFPDFQVSLQTRDWSRRC